MEEDLLPVSVEVGHRPFVRGVEQSDVMDHVHGRSSCSASLGGPSPRERVDPRGCLACQGGHHRPRYW